MASPMQYRSAGDPLVIYHQEFNAFIDAAKRGGAFKGHSRGVAEALEVANADGEVYSAGEVVIAQRSVRPFVWPLDDAAVGAAFEPPHLYVQYRDSERWGTYTAYQLQETLPAEGDVGVAVTGLVWALVDVQYDADRFAVPITKDADDCTMRSHCYGYPILYNPGAGAEWCLVDLSAGWEQGSRDGIIGGSSEIEDGEEVDVKVLIEGEVSTEFHTIPATFEAYGSDATLSVDDEVPVTWIGDKNQWQISVVEGQEGPEGRFNGPWQGIASDSFDTGEPGTVTAEAWEDGTSEEAINAGLPIRSGDSVLVWRIPEDEGEDDVIEDVYVCIGAPGCANFRDFFGVSDTHELDCVPKFQYYGVGCSYEDIDDCPGESPMAAAGDPIYVTTRGELQMATNYYGGQQAYITNDTGYTGHYMAVGDAYDAATHWMRIADSYILSMGRSSFPSMTQSGSGTIYVTELLPSLLQSGSGKFRSSTVLPSMIQRGAGHAGPPGTLPELTQSGTGTFS